MLGPCLRGGSTNSCRSRDLPLHRGARVTQHGTRGPVPLHTALIAASRAVRSSLLAAHARASAGRGASGYSFGSVRSPSRARTLPAADAAAHESDCRGARACQLIEDTPRRRRPPGRAAPGRRNSSSRRVARSIASPDGLSAEPADSGSPPLVTDPRPIGERHRRPAARYSWMQERRSAMACSRLIRWPSGCPARRAGSPGASPIGQHLAPCRRRRRRGVR